MISKKQDYLLLFYNYLQEIGKDKPTNYLLETNKEGEPDQLTSNRWVTPMQRRNLLRNFKI